MARAQLGLITGLYVNNPSDLSCEEHIIFTIVQHTWNSMAILIVMEVFLVLITAGTGIIEGVLQMASESLGGFMRS